MGNCFVMHPRAAGASDSTDDPPPAKPEGQSLSVFTKALLSHLNGHDDIHLIVRKTAQDVSEVHYAGHSQYQACYAQSVKDNIDSPFTF
jgi:hypothetical protein